MYSISHYKLEKKIFWIGYVQCVCIKNCEYINIIGELNSVINLKYKI